MDLRPRNKVLSEFSLASMSDLIFLLLIFFIITSTLVSPNAIKVVLPRATNQTLAKQSVFVVINDQRQIFIETNKKSEATTIELLPGQLQTALSGMEKPVVSIKADKTVPYEDVVQVISIAVKQKIGIVLATERE